MAGNAFFFQRMNDHVQYLNKIKATLEGTGGFVGTDFQDCKLGKWLYNEGPAEAAAISDKAKQMFEELLEPHQRFHESSYEAVQKHLAGDSVGAEAAITEMYKLSTVLVNMLLELDKLSHS